MNSLPIISSPQNPFFRHCLTLRDNRKRRRSGEFLIDGQMEIVRAFQAGFELTTLLVAEGDPLPTELQSVVHSAPGIAIQPLSQRLLERLSYGQMGAQPVAVSVQPELQLSKLQLDSDSLVLVLDRTEKPGNLGACLRSAAACGVAAVILTDPICDPFNANVIRASRGTVFGIPLAIAHRSEFLELAGELGLPIYAARVRAERNLWQLPLGKGAALLFGNETDGLSDLWKSQQVEDFTIPMSPSVDSLNLSISAALALFEATRQRTHIEHAADQ
jgi:RNA methyltransferase, TrmH family